MNELLEKNAIAHGLDPNLVKSIAMTESALNPWAIRYEPGWKYFYHAREYAEKNHITEQTEEKLQACSWSVMQCMGSVARELGYEQELTKLITPELSILYGCKKLKIIMQKYGDDPSKIAAAYNAGSVIMTMGGHFLNQNYVNKVNKNLIELTKLK